MMNHDWQYTDLYISKKLFFLGIRQGVTQCAWIKDDDGEFKLYNLELEKKTHKSIHPMTDSFYAAFSATELAAVMNRNTFSIRYSFERVVARAEPGKSVGIHITEAGALAALIVDIQKESDAFIIGKLNKNLMKLFYANSK